MSAVRIDPIADSWKAFKASTGIGHIAGDKDYRAAIGVMDGLVEAGAMKPRHPLNDLFLMLADLVHQYEQREFTLPKVSGPEVLRFLMGQHGLRQSDFGNEIGTQSVVSEILSGRRELNKSHIAALAKRFGISPAAFF
jgi:HTH-type transcriptional regulator/antitoxin HigA